MRIKRLALDEDTTRSVEKQDELGLNLYDYGARNYDAAIGRWMNVDPLAEDFPAWNPYNYTMNNPVNLTDPTGMSPEGLDNEYKVYTSGGKVQKVDEISKKGGDFVDHVIYVNLDTPAPYAPETTTEVQFVQHSESKIDTNLSVLNGKTAQTIRGPGFKHDVKYQAQSQGIEAMGVDSPFFVMGGVSSFLTRPASKGVPALRAAYEAEVKGLSSMAEKMISSGQSSEYVAKTLHGMRRELGIKYKALTPNDMLQTIYQRNIQKYGDKLGPTIDYLRNVQGKSWDDIINSATRSGGKDLKF